MSARMPGADSLDEFWRLLSEGRDAITEVPEGRWPDAGLTEFRRGGFLSDVDRFDAAFFGIGAAEAAAMDPQQRLILELSWQALEHARIAADTLRGTPAGVFMGASSSDYALLHDHQAPGPHSFAGAHRAIIANRVSYLLGLRGPSLTLDTGQSSSLVAVHTACEQLRLGTVPLALAGGVSLNLLGKTSAVIGELGALSPEGRCYAFDHRANGFVRGEGAAVIVLKPLHAAVADGDQVHAVILGGAVNNDGGGGSLTAPCPEAQEEVIRLACRNARVAPADVQYVELHGTGTRVGDPVEATALGAALGTGRPRGGTLLVGSVKTNIGHLDAAAGIAGLVKVILSLRHRSLPPSLNFERPNPAIPMEELNIEVIRNGRGWPAQDRRLVAGVSSFGMGGTNCHLILAEAGDQGGLAAREGRQPEAGGAPLVLSARSLSALRAQAADLAARLTGRQAAEPADLALSLVRTRAKLEHRAVILPGDRADLAARLGALAHGHADDCVVTGTATGGGNAFLFPGQGSQWPGMAGNLLRDGPAEFTARLTECVEAVQPFLDYSLLDVLSGAAGAADLERSDVVQPALWAVMVSLAELWRGNGVQPSAVIGHSQGEIAAATVVGALTLGDAARVVALRSQAVRALSDGRMLSVTASPAELAGVLAGFGGVTVAVLNSPRSTVLSGPGRELARLEPVLAAAGHRTRMLPVRYASHSPAVDRLREPLLAMLAPVRPVSTPVTFISTITGAPVDTACLDAEYWFRNLRQPVRFAEAVGYALAHGCGRFIECSPHPVLAASAEEIAEAAGSAAVAVGTLRRGEGRTGQVLRSLAQAHVAGAAVRWERYCAVPGARVTDLPGYPFQRQRHWITDAPAQADQARGPALSAAETRQLVVSAAEELAGKPADPDRAFKDLGLDSAGVVELRNRLQALTGLRLPTTLLFDFPTPGHLADALHGRLAQERQQPQEQLPVRDTAPRAGQPAEPIAIVAMGCRYPGSVTSPEELWRLLADGRDAISELPVNRGWDLDELTGYGTGRGTCVTRFGGFLHDADKFDAAFFGLSPRETLAMDPQQRLLLEICWEAIERAGIAPATLSGSQTGVFAGVMATDYGPRLHQPAGTADGHLLTGTLPSVASGRIAYAFGLNGPAITVDTACSSSLVAVHLAVQSLRRGECSLALAGGVTVMSNPGNLVEFSRQNGLAPDGRAKAFADSADGTAFSEGAGMLLLERVSDARRNGHPVLALIRGIAVNSDGASNGLTAPNGLAQQQVIRDALADAGLRGEDVDAVEAHGTGTALGDPIEAHAILQTYGKRGPGADPVWLGSLKSNVGHTQAAAGVGGVMKMVLAMRHETLPKTLHADQPTSRVDWSSGQARLLTQALPWRAGGRPRRAAVSSFGISGTNAHVVLEDTVLEETALDPAGPLVWVLSAKSAVALCAQGDRMCRYARSADDADLAAAGSLLARRTSFAHRAVVLAADRAELLAALGALAAGTPHPALVTGVAGRDAADRGIGPVFIFPGQGAQWAGMAAELFAANETFAAELRRCAQALQPHVSWPVLDVLTGAEGAPGLADTEVVQPALFAMMVSLAGLWRSAGVEPAAVVGHSQGEIAAAYVAGALPLADAARMIAVRSQVLGKLDGTGGVLAVGWPAGRVRREIASWPGKLWVAADNGPIGTVVAGDLSAIEELASALGDRVQVRRTPVAYAAHTPHVEAVRAELTERIGEVCPAEADTEFCSSVTGGFLSGTALTGSYWYRNLAEEVSFDAAVRAFRDRVSPLFIEVSPHPILAAAVQEILADSGGSGTAVGTLRRGEGGQRQFTAALAAAYVRGAAVAWSAVLGPVRRHVDLPGYAFDRERFWLSSETAGAGTLRHPLLRAAVPVAETGGVLLTGRLSRTIAPWLADHAVHGRALLPGTVFLELAAQAATASGLRRIEELTVHTPLALPEDGAVEVQVTVGAGDGDRRELVIHSRPEAGGTGAWARHASGTVAAQAAPAGGRLAQWPPDGATPIDLDAGYELLASRGYGYGPAFRALTDAWRAGSQVYAQAQLPATLDGDAGDFVIHPALLDAALHPLLLPEGGNRAGPDGLLLPFSWSGAWLRAAGADLLRVRITGRAATGVSLDIYDETGTQIGGVESLVLRPAHAAGAPVAANADLYQVDWEDAPPRAAARPPRHQETRLAVIGTSLDLAALPDPVPAVVLASFTTGSDEDPRAVRAALGEALSLVRQWEAGERFAGSRLVFLADHRSLSGSAVWGLVRSAQTEHPGRFVLADPGGAPTGSAGSQAAQSLVRALGSGEPQMWLRDDQILVPRLAGYAGGGHEPADLSGGTVLVTGGTGGLGALVATHLVTAHGVRDLLLTSRRGLAAPEAARLQRRLAGLGASVRVAACDVADRSALSALLATLRSPLTGVLHAAGVLADATATGLTAERLDAALRPKLDGGWLLHELTAGQPLEAFVLFSSVAALLGNAGQAGYAAANAYLDALALHRRALGMPAVSIAWGLWDLPTAMTSGMSGTDLARLADAGLAAMPAADGLAALDAALTGPDTPARLVACRWDMSRLRSRSESGEDVPAMLRRLVRPPRAAVGTAVPRLAERLAALDRAAATETLSSVVRHQVAISLGHRSPQVIDADRPLRELGLDSLTSVELRNRLGTEIGLRLPASLVFDHPTVTALARHLLDELRPASADTHAGPDAGDELSPWVDEASDDELFAFIDAH